MIFQGTLTNLKIGEVEEFCNRWNEGVRVEYGGSIMKNIPKAVSALANTQGGVLILGVDADKKNGRAIVPLFGMDFANGLEDTITNSCVDGIYPPLVPEVKVIQFHNDLSKCVVVVRVQESAQAPHAIQNRTRVYIRTGSQSNPVELVDMDRLKFMMDRRSKSERLREELICRCEEKFARVLDRDAGVPLYQLSIVPIYPHMPLCTPQDIWRWTTGQNRLPGFSEPRQTSGGVYRGSVRPGSKARGTYTEINEYGLLFQAHLENETFKDTAQSQEISGPSIVGLTYRCREFLSLAREFYSRSGFLGSLLFTAELHLNQPAAWRLIFPEWLIHDPNYFTTIDNLIRHEQILSVEELDEPNRKQITTQVVMDVAWSFGCLSEDVAGYIDKVYVR